MDQLKRRSSALVFAALLILAAAAGAATVGSTADSASNTGKTLRQAKQALTVAKRALRTAKRNTKAIRSVALTPGPAGQPGAHGERGPVGPTEGGTIDNWGDRGEEEYLLAEEAFNTTQAGRLFVTMAASAAVACETGNPWVWVEVDGSPLPGAVTGVPNYEFTPDTAFAGTLTGVTDAPRPAGQHVAKLVMRCPFGNLLLTQPGGIVSLTFVVLGG